MFSDWTAYFWPQIMDPWALAVCLLGTTPRRGLELGMVAMGGLAPVVFVG